MREMEHRKTPIEAEFVAMTPMDGKSIWRLKSWTPESAEPHPPVVVAGQELPCGVGATAAGAMRVLCVAPSEWLIVAASTLDDGVLRVIESELSGQGISLVNVTDAFTGFGVQGPGAQELLSKGCGLDFHARAFPAGSCTRTRLAHIPAVIDCLEASPRFEVYVARSHGDYLDAWFRDAAAEWTGTPP